MNGAAKAFVDEDHLKRIFRALRGASGVDFTHYKRPTIMRRLAAEGCAVLISTHVMQEISVVCDRIVVLAGGAVVATGTPQELQDRCGAAALEDAFISAVGSAEGLQS